jgi:hypothetical protein
MLMKKVIEVLLTTPSARNGHAVKDVAYDQIAFTPWE